MLKSQAAVGKFQEHLRLLFGHMWCNLCHRVYHKFCVLLLDCCTIWFAWVHGHGNAYSIGSRKLIGTRSLLGKW